MVNFTDDSILGRARKSQGEAVSYSTPAIIFNNRLPLNAGGQQQKPGLLEQLISNQARNRQQADQASAVSPSPGADSPQGDDFYNAHKALDSANSRALNSGIDPFTLMPLPKSPMDQMWDAMNQPFSFDPSQVDTSWIDNVLNSKNAAIDQARTAAQNNFDLSDKNIAGIADATRNLILGGAPALQQNTQKLQDSNTAATKQLLDANAARASQQAAEKAKMFADLGIQGAAAAPDLAAQELAKGANKLSENSQTETNLLSNLGQNAIDSNARMANAAFNQGAESRADLSRRLNAIFNGLDQKRLDNSTQAISDRANYINSMRQAAIQMWNQNRQFAQDQFNKFGDWQNAQDVANIRYGPNSRLSQKNQGLPGLNSVTNPDVVKGYYQLLAAKGGDANFNPNNLAMVAKAAQDLFGNGQGGVSPMDIVTYAQAAANAGRANYVNVDGSQ